MDTEKSKHEDDGLIGQVFGDYRILAELGAGGMGVVYSAEHVLLGRRAALKVLREKFSVQEPIVQRFFNEAKAASSIRHPGIVEVYDFGHHEGRAFLVMAHLEGESLETRLKREGRLPAEQAITVARQVAGALAAAHAQGIVHRDLKPDNIFLVPDPDLPGGERIQLLDFGIAKLTPEGPEAVAMTQTGAIMGSPLYMSPEQCQGAETVDGRTDLYSLGCVLFRMVCGRLPFESSFAADTIAAHLRDLPPAPRAHCPEASQPLEDVILRLLEKEPGKRYASAEALREALDALPEAPSTVSSSVELARGRAADRKRWVAAGMAAAVLCAAFAWGAAGESAEATGLIEELADQTGHAARDVPPTAVPLAFVPAPAKPEDALVAGDLAYQILEKGSADGPAISKNSIVIHHVRWWTDGKLLSDSRVQEAVPLTTVPRHDHGQDAALRLLKRGDTARFWFAEDKPGAPGGRRTEHVFEVDVLAVLPKTQGNPVTDDEIISVLGHFEGAVAACFDGQSLSPGTGFAVVLAIQGKGRVRATFSEDPALTGTVRRCLSRVLRAIRLPNTGHRREYRHRIVAP